MLTDLASALLPSLAGLVDVLVRRPPRLAACPGCNAAGGALRSEALGPHPGQQVSAAPAGPGSLPGKALDALPIADPVGAVLGSRRCMAAIPA